MTGTITFDLPSVLISSLALFVSVLAFLQTTRHRVPDRALHVHEQVVRLTHDITRISNDADDLKREWKATMSAVGSLQSGAMISRETDLNRVCQAARNIHTELVAVDIATPRVWQGRKVEENLRKLTGLRASADDLQSDLANHWQQLRETRQRAGL